MLAPWLNRTPKDLGDNRIGPQKKSSSQTLITVVLPLYQFQHRHSPCSMGRGGRSQLPERREDRKWHVLLQQGDIIKGWGSLTSKIAFTLKSVGGIARGLMRIVAVIPV